MKGGDAGWVTKASLLLWWFVGRWRRTGLDRKGGPRSGAFPKGKKGGLLLPLKVNVQGLERERSFNYARRREQG